MMRAATVRAAMQIAQILDVVRLKAIQALSASESEVTMVTFVFRKSCALTVGQAAIGGALRPDSVEVQKRNRPLLSHIAPQDS